MKHVDAELPSRQLHLHLRSVSGRSQLPIVFLHAFPLQGGMWEPQLAALANQGWTAYAPDLRGFGLTRPLPGADEAVTMEVMAQDVVALLDFYQHARAVLVGLSMGGYVAMAMARAYPERVAGLVLADTRPGADGPEVRANRERTARLALEKGVRAVAETMVGGLLRPGAGQDEVEAVLALAGQNDPAGVAAAARGMALRPDSTDTLRRLDCPALVLVGEHDGLSPVTVAESMASALPRGRLVVIPRAGHLANMENPGSFSTALLSFLREGFTRQATMLS